VRVVWHELPKPEVIRRRAAIIRVIVGAMRRKLQEQADGAEPSNPPPPA